MSRFTIPLVVATFVAGCGPSQGDKDAFAAMWEAHTTRIDRELTASEAKELRLFSDRRKLPANAANVRVAYIGSLDERMFVRFDAPLETARLFAEETSGVVSVAKPGWKSCCAGEGGEAPAWWIARSPENALIAEQRYFTDEYPITVVVVPMGDDAIVYVEASDPF